MYSVPSNNGGIMNKKYLNNKGYMLIFTLLIMFIFSIIGIFILSMAFENLIISDNNMKSTESYYMAESKIKLALYDNEYYNIIKEKIKEHIDNGVLLNDKIRIEDFFVKINFNKIDEGLVSIKVTNTYKNCRRIVKAIFNPFNIASDSIKTKDLETLSLAERPIVITIQQELQSV